MVFLVSVLSVLPLRVLYLISDMLFLLIYHISGYRKKVVRGNLTKAFPNLSKEEIFVIEKEFYSSFCDFIVETAKGYRIKPSEIQKRIVFTNLDELKDTLKTHKSVLFLTAHHFNWEWMQLSAALQFPLPIDYIYHPLHNKNTDQFMLKLRGRFGAQPVKRREAARHIIRRSTEKRGFAVLADQFPSGKDRKHWVTFLGIETAFYFSVEQLARLIKQPVLFFNIEKTGRGYYKVKMIPVTLNPAAEEEGAIIQKYAQAIENNIRQNPANWLWSHKRWKRLRKEEENSK